MAYSSRLRYYVNLAMMLTSNKKKSSITVVFLLSLLLAACSAIPGLLPPANQGEPNPADISPASESIAPQPIDVQATEDTRLTLEAPAPTETLLPTVTPTLFVDPAARQLLIFEGGSTQAEIFGAVEAFSVTEYLLPAGQFQRIEVSLRSADETLSLSMLSEDGLLISGDIEEPFFWRGQLPSSTNGVLRVIGGTERLIFSILAEVPAQIQLAEESKFESLQGQVSPEDRDAEYLLRPLEGETLTLKVNAPNNDVLLSATGVQDGQLYLGIPASLGGYTIDLPDTQDYLIAVLGTGPETQFTLDVSVKVPEPEDEVATEGSEMAMVYQSLSIHSCWRQWMAKLCRVIGKLEMVIFPSMSPVVTC